MIPGATGLLPLPIGAFWQRWVDVSKGLSDWTGISHNWSVSLALASTRNPPSFVSPTISSESYGMSPGFPAGANPVCEGLPLVFQRIARALYAGSKCKDINIYIRIFWTSWQPQRFHWESAYA